MKLTISIAACYCWSVFVPIALLVIAILAFELLRWNLRPVARRMRHIRRIDRARELARRSP